VIVTFAELLRIAHCSYATFPLIDDWASNNCRAMFLPRSAFLGQGVVLCI